MSVYKTSRFRINRSMNAQRRFSVCWAPLPSGLVRNTEIPSRLTAVPDDNGVSRGQGTYVLASLIKVDLYIYMYIQENIIRNGKKRMRKKEKKKTVRTLCPAHCEEEACCSAAVVSRPSLLIGIRVIV